MNRLRKTSESPQKSTSTALSNAVAARPPLQVNPPAFSQTYKAALQPQARSSSEQYWAARALTAETLLAARLEHHRELRSLSYVEETKRAREREAHDARHARLERLILALLVMLLLLVLALLHLAHKSASASTSRPRRLPSHFTIPILSPFTSVVEHETSVIGSKTLGVFAFAFAGLAYFVFRHWLARRRPQ
ncbi:hypothetical protein MSAN_00900400 [Mycena sanguinolenta]|uniref:Transmembrane protein n=1 Tax=Mycena sanguinolenta TaxID=230812 RepID=A0A8H6YSM7_9AGAR|nr:hypothetical protein MSAN_00900400 [Mycena sanguinolenta]